MKTLRLLLFPVLLLSACSSSTRLETKPSDFPLEVQEAFVPMNPKIWVLENGLEVHFLEERELPLFGATVFTRGGSNIGSPRLPGAAELMGEQLVRGGTKSLTSDALQDILQAHGATFSGNLGPEFGKFSVSGLSSDVQLLVKILSEALQHPRFTESSLSVSKRKRIEELKRRRDDPAAVATISGQQLLFPKSVYGRVLTPREVQRISTQHLRAEHARLISPEGAILTLQGPFSEHSARDLVDRAFGTWQGNKNRIPSEIPAPDPAPVPQLLWIERPSAQSVMLLSRQGVARQSSDEPTIEVFNSIFGLSGLNSLLSKHVRNRLGLAYMVHGGVFPGVARGRNSILLRTKPEQSYTALREALRVVEFLQSQAISTDELQATIRGLKNGFIFQNDSASKVLERQAVLKLLGYPDNYDSGLQQRLAQVTPDTLQRLAREQWDLSQAVIVLVGPKQAFNALAQGITTNSNLWPHFQLHKGHFGDQLEKIETAIDLSNTVTK